MSLSALLAAERDRWLLWLPVFLGLGIWVYFVLPREPSALAGPSACGLFCGLLWLSRRHMGLILACAATLATCAGFTAAQIRTGIVYTPILERETAPSPVKGILSGVEKLDSGWRLTLEDVRMARLPPERTPREVRIRMSGKDTVPPLGSLVEIMAVLSPPSDPAEPGAFDFRRHAFFLGLGGVGYAVSGVRILHEPEISWLNTVPAALESARRHMAVRIQEAMEQPSRGIVHALMTGEQTAIPADTLQAMRISGLSHLLSISGMHIGMVAGSLFFLVRALLALFPAIALRMPIKKWAAAAGILAALAYTILVEYPVPAQRSALMSSLVLFAIIVDRSALSMRVLAIAATGILLVLPESLLSISFQMSFAAVAALIATYEALQGRIIAWRRDSGIMGRAALYCGGVLLTSVVASLATAPFALYHFQQITLYGLLSNMAAVPVTGFVIMPAILVAYALMPLGLDLWPLKVAGWGTDIVVAIAHWTAAMPWARLSAPVMPGAGLALLVIGGLWICLWKRPWRRLGALPFIAGFFSLLFIHRPDILVSGDGKLVGLRDSRGNLVLSSSLSGKFEAGIWNQRDGRPATRETWPASGQSRDGSIACDALGCLYHRNGYTVAIIRDTGAAEDCFRADIVISPLKPLKGCPAPLVIDRRSLQKSGAHSLTLDPDDATTEVTRHPDIHRPWTPPEKPPRQYRRNSADSRP
ncbi:MAG: ComEC family competence protein [Pseudomonadota bacterium]|nr:ComEC family competence protein [Pseudomonadota bacterium]